MMKMNSPKGQHEEKKQQESRNNIYTEAKSHQEDEGKDTQNNKAARMQICQAPHYNNSREGKLREEQLICVVIFFTSNVNTFHWTAQSPNTQVLKTSTLVPEGAPKTYFRTSYDYTAE